MAEPAVMKMDVIGMSHAISVLRALAPDVGMSHETWSTRAQQAGFQMVGSLASERGAVALRAHLIPPSAGWRALMQDVDGRRTVAASQGFIDLLDLIAPDALLVSFIGGNEHSTLSLLNPEVAFDFVWPPGSAAPLLSGHQPVSVAVVQAQLLAALHQTLAQLTMIRARHPGLRIVHVAPPPPHANEARMHTMPEAFGALLAHHGLMPLSIRLKYYGLYVELLKRELAPLRIDCLGAPAASFDSQGALLEPLTLASTHGNEAYGALVLQQLRALV